MSPLQKMDNEMGLTLTTGFQNHQDETKRVTDLEHLPKNTQTDGLDLGYGTTDRVGV